MEELAGVTVYIWRCQGCATHQVHTKHDESRYIRVVEQLSEALRRETGVTVVSQPRSVAPAIRAAINSRHLKLRKELYPFASHRAPPPSSQPQLPSVDADADADAEVKESTDGTDSEVPFFLRPRLGALEVYVERKSAQAEGDVAKTVRSDEIEGVQSRPQGKKQQGLASLVQGLPSNQKTFSSPPLTQRSNSISEGGSPRSLNRQRPLRDPLRSPLDADKSQTSKDSDSWEVLYSKLQSQAWPSPATLVTAFLRLFPPPWDWAENPYLRSKDDYHGRESASKERLDVTKWVDGWDYDEVHPCFPPRTPKRLLETLIPCIKRHMALISEKYGDSDRGGDGGVLAEGGDEEEKRRLEEQLDAMCSRVCRVPFLIDLIESEGTGSLLRYQEIASCNETTTVFAWFVSKWKGELARRPREMAYRLGAQEGLGSSMKDLASYKVLTKEAHKFCLALKVVDNVKSKKITKKLRAVLKSEISKAEHTAVHRIAESQRFLSQILAGKAYGIHTIMEKDDLEKCLEIESSLNQYCKDAQDKLWKNRAALNSAMKDIVGGSIAKRTHLFEALTASEVEKQRELLKYITVKVAASGKPSTVSAKASMGNTRVGGGYDDPISPFISNLQNYLAKLSGLSATSVTPVVKTDDDDGRAFTVHFELRCPNANVAKSGPKKIVKSWSSDKASGNSTSLKVMDVSDAGPPIRLTLLMVPHAKARALSDKNFRSEFMQELRDAAGSSLRLCSINKSRTCAILSVKVVETAIMLHDLCSRESILTTGPLGSCVAACWYVLGADDGRLPGQWGAVKAFVSSTFSDMHSERNHLAAYVWPALRNICLSRGIVFSAIDFRWGGVSFEDSKNRLGLVACLEKVDECFVQRRVMETASNPLGLQRRPLMLSLLGSRRGWVPPYSTEPLCWCGKDISHHRPKGCICYGKDGDNRAASGGHNPVCPVKEHPPTDHDWTPGEEKVRSICGKKYPWVCQEGYREHSVTRLEVEHAHLRNQDASETHFMIRQMPRDFLDTPLIPSIAKQVFFERDPTAETDAKALSALVLKTSPGRVAEYAPSGVEYVYESRDVAKFHLKELSDGGKDKANGNRSENSDRERAIEASTNAVEGIVGDEGIDDPSRLGNIAGHGVKLTGMEEFGVRCGVNLLSSILLHAPPHLPATPLNPHVLLRMHNASLVGHSNEVFAGREDSVEDILALARDSRTTYLNVWGDPGVGKTTVACKLIDTISKDESFEVIPFIGQPWTRWEVILEYLSREMFALLDGGYRLHEVWGEDWIRSGATTAFLKAGKRIFEEFRKKLVIVVDGVEDKAALFDLASKSSVLQGAGKVVVFTSKPLSHVPESVKGEVSYRLDVVEDSESRKAVAMSCLRRFGKDRADRVAAILAKKKGGGNPRYLFVAAHETAYEGVFETHEDLISSYPSDLRSLWAGQVVPRLATVHSVELVTAALDALSSVPSGMTPTELKTLVERDLSQSRSKIKGESSDVDGQGSYNIPDMEFQPLLDALKVFCCPSKGTEILSLIHNFRAATRIFIDDPLEYMRRYEDKKRRLNDKVQSSLSPHIMALVMDGMRAVGIPPSPNKTTQSTDKIKKALTMTHTKAEATELQRSRSGVLVFDRNTSALRHASSTTLDSEHDPCDWLLCTETMPPEVQDSPSDCLFDLETPNSKGRRVIQAWEKLQRVRFRRKALHGPAPRRSPTLKKRTFHNLEEK